MDILKTPHQMLLEEAGAKVPTSNGMLKTPQQMLMEETGLPQKFADGGSTGMSVQDMLAAIMAQGQTPQKFAPGGSVLGNVASQSAFALPFIPEDAKQIAQDVKAQKYPEAAARTAGVGFSAFAPFNPLTALISGATYSPEVGDATLEGWKKQELERQMMEQYKAKLKADQLQKIKETRFYKQ
jgi:hypothetical protein